jgi:serine phosphatase RsbU (regulator of sigma subunit)
VTGLRSGSHALAGALLLIAALTVMDLGTGRDTNVSGAFAAAPFLAATLCSLRTTAAVSGLALAVAAALVVVDDTTGAEAAARLLVVLLAALVAPFAAQGRIDREQRIRELSRVAEVAQLAVLTPLPPTAGPVALSARYLSASRGALIGGDLYAVVETDAGVRLIVGDVRGKGLDAVSLAALVLSTFRERAAGSQGLSELCRAIDARLSASLGSEDFVTAVLAEIDHGGAVRLVSCGHPPPVSVRAGSRELVESVVPTSPFGLGPTPEPVHFRMAVGDRLLFYTDGLTEARALGRGFVDLDSVLGGICSDDLDAALDGVLTRLRAQARPIRDDLALLLVERVS